MTRQKLKSYRMYQREIEDLNEEIDSGRTYASVISAAEFPYSKHLVTVYGGPEHNEIRMEAADRRRILSKECREIEQFVSDIPDPITRRVFELKYLFGFKELTWREISLQIGGGNSESAVKVRHHRLLHKNL